MKATPTYEDRTYHGIQDGWENPTRIEVEAPVFGPTERESITVLYELHPADPADGGEFGWGYNGGGTSRAAAAILADALDLGDQEEAGIALGGENDVLVEMREDFCVDVLSQFCDEWRLRRGVVLRWARAWHLQYGIAELPAALVVLPGFHPELAG